MSTFDPTFALAQVFARAPEEERPHLRVALGDDAGRAAYAAWLRGRGDPRGEALTLERRLRDEDDPAAASRLRELLPAIDRAWWWVMRRAEIRNCGGQRGAPPRVRFSFLCERSWASLEATGEDGVRSCEQCNERVYRCASAVEAAARARRGECIAVAPELAAEQATDGRGLFVGRPDYVAMWAARLFPDDDRE
ncbi:MAG: hypothetical protein KC486_29465 [Myxococcales bacterium]|nr:hypothetical protein [Myxococcales bacterium]